MGTQLTKQYLYGKKMQKTCTKNMSQNPLGKSLKQTTHAQNVFENKLF